MWPQAFELGGAASRADALPSGPSSDPAVRKAADAMLHALLTGPEGRNKAEFDAFMARVASGAVEPGLGAPPGVQSRGTGPAGWAFAPRSPGRGFAPRADDEEPPRPNRVPPTPEPHPRSSPIGSPGLARSRARRAQLRRELLGRREQQQPDELELRDPPCARDSPGRMPRIMVDKLAGTSAAVPSTAVPSRAVPAAAVRSAAVPSRAARPATEPFRAYTWRPETDEDTEEEEEEESEFRACTWRPDTDEEEDPAYAEEEEEDDEEGEEEEVPRPRFRPASAASSDRGGGAPVAPARFRSASAASSDGGGGAPVAPAPSSTAADWGSLATRRGSESEFGEVRVAPAPSDVAWSDFGGVEIDFSNMGGGGGGGIEVDLSG